MPQLEDDALIFSLHDVIGEDLEDEMSGVTSRDSQSEVAEPRQRYYYLSRDPTSDDPINKQSAQRDLEHHKPLFVSDMQLHGRLNAGLTQEEATLEVGNSPPQVDASGIEMGINVETSIPNGDVDSSYFASYSGHGNCSCGLTRRASANTDRHP